MSSPAIARPLPRMSWPKASCSSAARAGAPAGGGVVVWPQAGARPAAAAQAALAIWSTPAGSGESARTAKVTVVAGAPAGREPRVRVQVAPAGPAAGLHVQAGELAVGAKVVCAGTVSVRVTPAASWSPLLVAVSWKGSRAPAAAGGPV